MAESPTNRKSVVPSGEPSELETEAKPEENQPEPDKVIEQPVEKPEVKDPPIPRYIWTHPEHGLGCLFATCCKYVALGFTMIAVFKKPFTDREENKYYFSEVYCKDDGVCMLPGDAANNSFTESSGLMMVVMDFRPIDAALGADTVDLGILCVFWMIYLCTGKVNNFLLRFSKFYTGIFAYFKFGIGWLLVSCIGPINFVYAWGTTDRSRLYNKQIYDAALRMSPWQISHLFFSFCLDIVCLAFLIVTLDPGTPGMSHRKRLMLEEKARLHEEEVMLQPSRRGSYIPEQMSKHDEKVSASAVSLQDLTASKSTVKPSNKSLLKPPGKEPRKRGSRSTSKSRGSASTAVTNVTKATNK